MSSKITFYVVRHGKTLMNTLDRVQGWCDSPLTAEGIEIASCLGRGLKDISFRGAYCSTLKRTKDTAQIILKSKGQTDIIPVEIDGFKEAGFGSFESGANAELWSTAAHHLCYDSTQTMTQDILLGKIDYRAVMKAIKTLDTLNMAEGFDEVETRTQKALKAIAEEEALNGDGNILIVAHAMSIIAMLMGLGGNRLFRGLVENASVSKVVYENGVFTVESMNDLSYVKRGKMKLSVD